MRRHVFGRPFAVLVALAVVVASCSQTAQPSGTASPATGVATATAAATAAPKVANIYLYQKPKIWSPLAGFNGPDMLVMNFTLDRLVDLDDKYELRARLAERWEVSPDATKWTFFLRKGVKWSDGAPFTAKDVLFTFQSIMDPRTGSANVGRLAGVKGAADFKDGKIASPPGLQLVDDTTFRIELDKPNAAFLTVMAAAGFQLIPEHVLGSAGPKDLNSNPFFLKPTIGLGPFTFVRYETDQFIELARNPNFWGSRPGLDRIFLKPVTTDVATAQLEKGEMDLVQVSPTDVERLQKVSGVKIHTAPGSFAIIWSVNMTRPPFDDKRVRQAMLYAIDRAGIVKTVLGSYGSVTNTDVRGPSWAVEPNLNPYAYSPEKAKLLLKDAGWDAGKTYKLMYIPGPRDREAAAQIAQGQLAAVGMKLDLVPIEVGPFLEKIKNKDFDVVMGGGGAYSFEPDAISIATECAQGYPAGGNIPFYCNKRVDELLAKGRATSVQAERAAIYKEVSRILNDEVVRAWLYMPSAVWASRDRLTSFKVHGDLTSSFWNAEEWGLK